METPFFGQIRVTDIRIKGTPQALYILVRSKDDIVLYNQPPPFDIMNLVGGYGKMWNIRRIKRGWVLSSFIMTIDNVSFECKSYNKFADLLDPYLSH
jgi:hypothetical protein